MKTRDKFCIELNIEYEVIFTKVEETAFMLLNNYKEYCPEAFI